MNWRTQLGRQFQYYLDRSAPHQLRRWLLTLALALLYAFRVYCLKGFHVVSYGLATYLLNLFIGFMSPKLDPDLESFDAAPTPSPDFKPFERRLSEFRFWYSITKAFIVSFILSFISVLDVPVFWPILSSYWLFLFLLTMCRQILHMIKHKYNPFRCIKPQYHGNSSSSGSSRIARNVSAHQD